MTAKGTLTIHGVAKSDVGDAGNFEQSKSAVSDALKRTGVMWGVARELYSLPQVWCQLDSEGRTPPAMLAKLAQRLDQLAAAASVRTIETAVMELPQRCLAAAGVN